MLVTRLLDSHMASIDCTSCMIEDQTPSKLAESLTNVQQHVRSWQGDHGSQLPLYFCSYPVDYPVNGGLWEPKGTGHHRQWKAMCQAVKKNEDLQRLAPAMVPGISDDPQQMGHRLPGEPKIPPQAGLCVIVHPQNRDRWVQLHVQHSKSLRKYRT